MKQLVYKCTPENIENLRCFSLRIFGEARPDCEFCTENGYCSRDIDTKKVVDKLGRLEEEQRER